jgi:hypothetical protein
MPSRAYFLDHAAFHRQVLRLAVAGAGLALLAYFVPLGDSSAILSLLVLATTTATYGLVAQPPARTERFRSAVFAACVGAIAVLCQCGAREFLARLSDLGGCLCWRRCRCSSLSRPQRPSTLARSRGSCVDDAPWSLGRTGAG